MRWRHIFSVAPMMEYTDTHQRHLMRLLSKNAVLYTEMVTANALCRGSDDVIRKSLQADHSVEGPVVLQLGGSDPVQMSAATKVALAFGYRDVNLNVGCPSEKVAGKGCFGAALMLQPDLVADLCIAVSENTGIPTTVKCRIGVNDVDSYDNLHAFIHTVTSRGKVDHFIVHARKAILNANFSPHDNRKIPPLKYDYVYQLIKDYPHIKFTINGGINTYEDINGHISNGVHGVMVGRSVVNTPYYWRHIDDKLYGINRTNNSDESCPNNGSCLSRRQLIEIYSEYARRIEVREGDRVRSALMKPVLGVFSGVPNGRLFRRKIDESMKERGKLVGDVIVDAMESSLDNDLLDDVVN